MIYIKNAQIVNEGVSFRGGILINSDRIERIYNYQSGKPDNNEIGDSDIIDAEGMFLIPGVIDDQVHFREPGATWKGDIESESKAALLGGVTSFMDMPNNNPPIVSIEALNNKYNLAGDRSLANYSLYFGADNNNIEDIERLDIDSVCGVKVFMGSSTGNMLVDDLQALEKIFSSSPVLVATHCEDETIIRENLRKAKERYGDDIPFSMHPVIRSREACIASTKRALDLAIKYNTRLHILHVSTAEEVDMIAEVKRINPLISAETCVHYMWFDSSQYAELGAGIKCNPAIKDRHDKEAITKGVRSGVIDIVATDHAPHLFSEKENPYLSSPSGLPLVQHSLQLMLELSERGIFTLDEVVDKMCHSPAEIFAIKERGYIREGYYADLVLFTKGEEVSYRVSKENIAYKCGWSPLEGTIFHSQIISTFLNGREVVKNGEVKRDRSNAKKITFNREKINR